MFIQSYHNLLLKTPHLFVFWFSELTTNLIITTCLTGTACLLICHFTYLKNVLFWFLFSIFFFRWNHIESVLKKEQVQIIGYSSDGDTRLLKAMKVKNVLSDFSVNCPRIWKSFFFAEFESEHQCIQDSIHIGNKLKNRLLKKKVHSSKEELANGGKPNCGAPIIIGKFLKLLLTKYIFNIHVQKDN